MFYFRALFPVNEFELKWKCGQANFSFISKMFEETKLNTEMTDLSLPWHRPCKFLKDLENCHRELRNKFVVSVNCKAISTRSSKLDNVAPLVSSMMANRNKNILKKVATDEDFQKLMDYLNNPKECFECYAEQSLENPVKANDIEELATDAVKDALH